MNLDKTIWMISKFKNRLQNGPKITLQYKNSDIY